MGRAAEEIYQDFDSHIRKLRELKAYFIEEVMRRLEGVQVNGRTDEISAPHIISLSVGGVRAEVLLHALEDKKVYVSAGSACSTNRPHVSSTLRAIGLEQELLDSTLRFSMSVFTEKEELDQAIDAMQNIVPMLRKYSRQ
jgi:cysteine desulfurase